MITNQPTPHNDSSRTQPQRGFRPGAPRLLAVSAVTMLALAGCSGQGGSDDGGSSSAPASSPAASTQPATSPAPSSDGGAASASESASSMGGSQAPGTSLEDAGAAALKEVSGGTVISIETEANQSRWEVQVAAKDGTEHEINIDAKDGSVVGSPSEKQEDAMDRQKHQDRVAAAKLDYKEAAGKFRDAVKGAEIVELNLDTEKGQTVWEGDMVDGNGAKHAVAIDAASGEVVSNSTDTDG